MSQTLLGGSAGHHEQVVIRVRCHLRSFEPPFNVYSRPPTQTEENWRSMGVNTLCTNPILLDASVFIRRHKWDRCHSTMCTKRRHQKCFAVQGCGEVSITFTATPQMQKFSRAKYFEGKICKELNFCGSGHPQKLKPLKLNEKDWKGTKWQGNCILKRPDRFSRRRMFLSIV